MRQLAHYALFLGELRNCTTFSQRVEPGECRIAFSCFFEKVKDMLMSSTFLPAIVSLTSEKVTDPYPDCTDESRAGRQYRPAGVLDSKGH